MPADWLGILGPIASAIISKLSNGQKVTPSEQNFVLLYSLTEATQKTAQELVTLRADLNRLCSRMESLQEALTEVRADTSYIKGRLS